MRAKAVVQSEPHAVYTDKNFYQGFTPDLDYARGLIILHVPYASTRRVDLLLPALRRATTRGVLLCVLVQKPKEWRSTDPADQARLQPFLGALRLLKSVDAHVIVRSQIHEKLAIIDGEILWEGSLNILSHYESRERMTRWVSREKVLEAMKTHNLNSCKHCTARPEIQMFLGMDQSHELRMRFIGDCLKRRRESRNLSQRDLAERVGVHKTVVARIERGTANVTLTTLIRVLAPLGLEMITAPREIVPSVERAFHQ